MTEAAIPIDAIDPVPERKPRKKQNGALTRVEAAPVPATISEAASLLQVISKAAADPNIDVVKLERLMGLHEKIMAQQAKAAYLAAFAEMQTNLPTIAKNGEIERKDKDGNTATKPGKKQKYALWEDINEAIIPILAAHGFSLSHRIEQPTADRLSVTTIVGHREGHSEQTSISLPFDGSGGKNNMHGWGSAASYGKRYTTLALLPITTRGDDDDGNAAGAQPSAFITDAQCQTILDKIAETNSDTARFCNYFVIEGVAKLPAGKFEMAMAMFNQKVRK